MGGQEEAHFDFKDFQIPQQKLIDGIPFPKVLFPGQSLGGIENGISEVGEAVKKHREWLESLLHSSGALLFRGFPINSAEDFNQLVEAFGYEELPYVGGAAPRTNIVGRVFTSNESPPDQKIPFHHEMAQVALEFSKFSNKSAVQ